MEIIILIIKIHLRCSFRTIEGSLNYQPETMHYFQSKSLKMSISQKVTTHPDIAHPFGNPRSPTMKGIPAYSPLVKVACSGCVPVRCVETTLASSFIPPIWVPFHDAIFLSFLDILTERIQKSWSWSWSFGEKETKLNNAWQVQVKVGFPEPTLPETNIFAENGWLEYDPAGFLLGQTAYFQGRTVTFRECKHVTI